MNMYKPAGIAGGASADFDRTAFGPVVPWPAGHVPGEGVETRMWLSFAELKIAPSCRLSIRGVARHGGVSATPIATEVCKMQVLRDAILDEMRQREPKAPKVEPSSAEKEAAKEAHRQTRITYWQKVAQRTDSLLGEYEVRAINAEATSRKYVRLLTRIYEDMKARRLIPGDADSVTVADLVALLGAPPKRPKQPDDIEVE